MIYREQRLYRAAAQAYDSLLHLDGTSLDGRYELGQVYALLGKTDLSRQQLAPLQTSRRQAAARYPAAGGGHAPPTARGGPCGAGALPSEQRRLCAGAAQFQTAAGLDPHNAAIEQDLERFYSQLGWGKPEHQIPMSITIRALRSPLHASALLLLGLLIAALCAGCPQNAAPPGGTTPAAKSPFYFVDVTAKAGIPWLRTNGGYGGKLFPEAEGGGGAFLDYDNDGYLNILLINGDWWPGHPLKGPRPTLALYHNNGNGTFTDVTAQMGLNVSMQGLGVAVGDYDNDGYDDVLITGVGGNRLFHNEGGKRFVDVTAASGVGGSGWSTSAAWVDYDNDGKLDLFVCHYCKWSQATDLYCGGQIKIYCTPEAYPGESCRLYHNLGNGRFQDVTKQAGIRMDRGKALGICTVDFDHDGKIDLIVANDGEPNVAYRNIGGKFKDVSVETNLALGEDGKPRNGMGIDAADYKNNGTLGVLVGNFSYQGAGLQHEVGSGLFNDVAHDAGIQQPSLPYVTFGVLFGDLDNDGWKDAVICNGHTDDMAERSLPEQHVLQPTQIFANRHNGTFQEVTQQAGPGLQLQLVGRGMACGDFDNDGLLDLLLIQNAGAPHLLHNEFAGPTGRPKPLDQVRSAGHEEQPRWLRRHHPRHDGRAGPDRHGAQRLQLLLGLRPPAQLRSRRRRGRRYRRRDLAQRPARHLAQPGRQQELPPHRSQDPGAGNPPQAVTTCQPRPDISQPISRLDIRVTAANCQVNAVPR